MKHWSIILGIVLLAGCARFQSQLISPAESAAKLESRSLTNAVLKAYLENNLHRELSPWPTTQWDLEMLTLAAFYYQPGLEVARAQWRVAQAEVQTAGGRPNPTLTAGPGYNFSAAGGLTPWMPFGSLDLPIETAGKRRHRIARAEHLSAAVRLNLATTAWSVRSSVRAGLLDVATARRRADILSAQTSLAQQIVVSLEQRRQAGATSGAELGVAHVARARTQTELADARRQLAEANARVAEAVGIQLDALNGIELSFNLSQLPAWDELTSATVREQALQKRTDILGALAGYAASQSALQLEIAKQYPDIHLNPGYQWDQGENKWQLGLTAELPVFNQNQGPITEARARCAESAARFEAAQAKAIAEIDRATAELGACRTNASAVQGLAAAYQSQRESVAAQVRAGATEPLDLLNAQLESGAVALAELEVQMKLQQAIGAWEDAVQRPLNLPTTAFESSPNQEKEQSK